MAIKFQIIIATFNRREITLACLGKLNQIRSDRYTLDILVCDDGSTDGTIEAINVLFPRITTLSTPGNFFWAKTMNFADNSAETNKYDYLVWLNDDTDLDPNAFDLLLEDYEVINRPEAIMVGALRDPNSHARTYSGCLYNLIGRKIELEFISPIGIPIQIGMFSGNFVCIPRGTRSLIGPISDKFSHGWADMEYGFRGKKFDIPSYLMSSYVGFSALNPLYSKHTDPNVSWILRFKHIYGKKAYHPIDYARFCFLAFGGKGLVVYLRDMKRVFKETFTAR